MPIPCTALPCAAEVPASAPPPAPTQPPPRSRTVSSTATCSARLPRCPVGAETGAEAQHRPLLQECGSTEGFARTGFLTGSCCRCCTAGRCPLPAAERGAGRRLVASCGCAGRQRAGYADAARDPGCVRGEGGTAHSCTVCCCVLVVHARLRCPRRAGPCCGSHLVWLAATTFNPALLPRCLQRRCCRCQQTSSR